MTAAKKQALLSLLRGTLLIAGTIAVSRGAITQDLSTLVIGTIINTATMYWGAASGSHKEKKAAAREAAAFDAGRNSTDQGVK